IGDLPSLPHVVTRILRLVESPTASAAQVSQAISSDQALTSKVLRVANSAYYGFPYQIATVAHATVILGFRAVKTLVISAFASAWFDEKGDVIDRQKLWQHSVGCAVAARLLAPRVGWRDAEEAFTAGLLHDIGRVMLDRYAHRQLRQAVEMARADALSLREAEQSVFGFTHSELGQWVMEQWKLPLTLCVAIGHHHTPQSAPAHGLLVWTVAGADWLCGRLAIGADDDPMTPEFEQDVLRALRLSSEDAPALEEAFWTQWERATEILGLVGR
ncbi:MAG: HDOD domain-containing protein, partial [Abditibacteriales bacterium]|nr:HDOD domain-containing protein [Abditibacteriales bacterium]